MSKKKKSSRFNECLVRKRSHIFEKFSENKFKKSLLSTGLSDQKSAEVLEEVREHLSDKFSTAELYKTTGKAIYKRSRVCAANYNIKRGIYALGPDGYSFEIFCAEMLKAKGFETKVSVMKDGCFVKHEIDVVAKRDDRNIYAECKFHNKKYHKSDIKTPLYINSRSLDIKQANPSDSFEFAIFTNTKFSEDAISYGKGVGLLLYSLNYPERNTFIDLIRKYKVYPVTILKSLRVRDQRSLLNKKIVVVKQVTQQHLIDIGLTNLEITKILKEIKILTRPN
jgi:hypothetical protein